MVVAGQDQASDGPGRGGRFGRLCRRNAKNVVAPRVAATKAWDAVVDPRSGEHTSTAPVKLSVLQQGKGKAVVTMTPDQGWLADPTRVFPITIDPTYASANVTTSFDIYVSSLYPTATYSTSTELRVGTYGSGDKYRSFLSFPLASFGGKDTVSASLSLYEFYSWSCTAKPFYSYGTVGQPPRRPVEQHARPGHQLRHHHRGQRRRRPYHAHASSPDDTSTCRPRCCRPSGRISSHFRMTSRV